MKQSFETPGGELTAREIAQQPDVWLDIATLVDRERARLGAFLAPALANPRSLVLSGSTSTQAFDTPAICVASRPAPLQVMTRW